MTNRKKALLVVSFGTTYEESLRKNIMAVERETAEKLSLPVYRAFTSNMVRRELERRGMKVDDVPQALIRMKKDGVNELLVLPTHLLFGREYDKMRAQLSAFQKDFTALHLANPLLATTEDLRTVLQAVHLHNPLNCDEALVLMGHGTDHFCNPVYAAMDFMAKAEGFGHIFVGTVEAFPDLGTTLKNVQRAGYRRVLLTPLMLVAGDHATNDMASAAPDSWRSRFEQAGILVRSRISGLGEYPSIRALYLSHALAAK